MLVCQTKGCKWYGRDCDDNVSTVCECCGLKMVDIEENDLPFLLKFTDKGYRFRRFDLTIERSFNIPFVDEEVGMKIIFEYAKAEAFESIPYLNLSKKVLNKHSIDKTLSNVIQCTNMGICASFMLKALPTTFDVRLDILIDEEKDENGNTIAISPGFYITTDSPEKLFNIELLHDEVLIKEMLYSKLPRLLLECEILDSIYDDEEFDDEDEYDEEE